MAVRRKKKKDIVHTKLEYLPKREQNILREWLDLLDEIEEMEEALADLRAKESKVAAKVLKVLKKVDEEAVRIADGIVKLSREKRMVQRPSYKELYERALPKLSKRMQSILEDLRESMIKYKVIERPKLIRGGVKEKARKILDRIKGWVKAAGQAIKDMIAWIKDARKVRKLMEKVLVE